MSKKKIAPLAGVTPVNDTTSAKDGMAVDLSTTDWTTGLVSTGSPPSTRALLVGTAGNVKVDMVGPNGQGTGALTLPVVVGWNPIMCTKIYKVGTTATGIFAMW